MVLRREFEKTLHQRMHEKNPLLQVPGVRLQPKNYRHEQRFGPSLPRTRRRGSGVWFGRILENAVGAALAQIPNAKLWYWREGHDEVDFVVKTGGKTFALEIKSGRVKGTTKGLIKFAERHPGTICLTWDIARCERFLREGEIGG